MAYNFTQCHKEQGKHYCFFKSFKEFASDCLIFQAVEEKVFFTSYLLITDSAYTACPDVWSPTSMVSSSHLFQVMVTYFVFSFSFFNETIAKTIILMVR